MRPAVVAHAGKTFGGGLPELRRTLILQPIGFAAVSLLRLALRWRREDPWDLRWRLAFAKGYLSRHRLSP